MLITILSYGVMLKPELAQVAQPSMAGVLAHVVGPWGTVFIGIGLIISVTGAYLSWCLLAAEVLYFAEFWPTLAPKPTSIWWALRH